MRAQRFTIRLIGGSLIFLFLVACQEKKPENLNRLASSSSPYLREHADNPVDWYEWGDEALQRAEREDKPLLVSIGYASCHWCHVMEREAFMDTAIARFMNEHFINIKIDREERPDIDQIFVHAAELISGNAGWPLNAFAMPDGKPFFAGTYFPPSSWLRLLRQVSDTYSNDREQVRKQADAVTQNLRAENLFTAATDSDDLRPAYEALSDEWVSQLDTAQGGLKGAPKFPLPIVSEFFLQHHYLTSDKPSLAWVTATLNKMRDGGLYDHLGGGFARYSTDSLWRVPHFEKMLYDNAQLVSLYAHAFQATRDESYARIVDETLTFIQNELTSPQGGFYSSINADSEGEEGKFYEWTRGEIEDLLGKAEASRFCAYFNVTMDGNWEEGKNVLHTSEIDLNSVDQLAEARAKLLKARNERVRPTTDDKVLTSWNALMIMGYVNAYLALQRDDYLQTALKNAELIDRQRVDEKGHVWRNKTSDQKNVEGFLDDYAQLARAYIALYQAMFDIRWLHKARLLADYAWQNFRDEGSGLFHYSLDGSAQHIVKTLEVTDHVIPSSNSVMAEVLFLLGEYFDEERYRSAAQEMISVALANASGKGPFFANWAKLAGMQVYQPYEIAVTGPDARNRSNELLQHYLPTSVVLGGDSENLPLLENKIVKGKTIIYVCRNKVCRLPVETVEDALRQMK